MDDKLICKICGRECKNYIGLSSHIRFNHKDINMKIYYDLYLKKESEGNCQNKNCNKKTNYFGINYGYAKYCSKKCSSITNIHDEIKTTKICDYGCNQIAKYYFETANKWCCSNNANCCNGSKKRFIKRMVGKCGWSKGLTKNSDKRILKSSLLRKGKDGRTKENIEKQRQYMLNGGSKYSNSFPRNPERHEKVRELNRQKLLNGQAVYMNKFIKNPSKPQVELYNRIKEIYPSAILNYPCYPLNFSLDVAISELMICFESDGSYWHLDKEKDLERQKKVEELGWKCIRYYPVDYIKQVPSIEKIKEDIEEVNKNV